MKGEVVLLHGEQWVVVDVAPAPELADMVALLLEEEGYRYIVKGPDFIADTLQALGSRSAGITWVLVPEAQATAALAFIAENVQDFEGEELETIMKTMTPQEQREFFGFSDDDSDDEDGDDDDEANDDGWDE